MTIIEIVITLSLIAIITALGLVALNPGGQLAGARNSQRSLHLTGIMNGIRQNMAETSGGGFTCAAGTIPATTTKMAVGGGNYDIGPCLTPTYLPVLPFDPKTASAHFNSVTDYDTGYTIVRNASTGVVTLAAPSAEQGKTITLAR